MFKQLSPLHAFSRGSSLWIIQYLNTPLSFKIDWHTLFMARKPHAASQPLLIECSLYLPCSHVCFIPFNIQQPSSWLEQARNSWIKLNKPSLRIFLPSPGINQEDIEQFWRYEPLPYKIEQVIDRPQRRQLDHF